MSDSKTSTIRRGDEPPKHDGEHCWPDCPHKETQTEYDGDFTALCEKTGEVLVWHDYWLACCTEKYPEATS
jgi:hypothetical protein